MKYNLIIRTFDEEFEPYCTIDENVNLNYDENMVNIILAVNLNTKIEDAFSKDKIINMLKKELDSLSYERQKEKFLAVGIDIENPNKDFENDEVYMSLKRFMEFQKKVIGKLISLDKDIISTFEKIIIYFDEDDSLNNLAHNEFFHDKEVIVYGKEFSINDEDLNIAKTHFENYPNVKIYVDGNQLPISYIEYKKTVEFIDEIILKIKKYNMSPLEQVMYAYDMIKERIYTKGDDSVNPRESRDLTSVLLGDKIVCVGYATIFDIVLKRFNINCVLNYVENINKPMSGHVNNIAYIKDEKYNVEGIYYFDITADSRKETDSMKYLNRYEFFCKLKEEINILEPNYTNGFLDDYDTGTIFDFEDIVEEEGITNVSVEMMNTLNKVSYLVNKNKIIKRLWITDIAPDFYRDDFNFEKVTDELYRQYRLVFENKINLQTFTELVYNVRKIEYYENPTMVPFSHNDIKESVMQNTYLSLMKPYYRALCGNKFERKDYVRYGAAISSKEFDKQVDEEKLEKKILQIKLAKTISQIKK